MRGNIIWKKSFFWGLSLIPNDSLVLDIAIGDVDKLDTRLYRHRSVIRCTIVKVTFSGPGEKYSGSYIFSLAVFEENVEVFS